jgi:hypothetical protein
MRDEADDLFIVRHRGRIIQLKFGVLHRLPSLQPENQIHFDKPFNEDKDLILSAMRTVFKQ